MRKICVFTGGRAEYGLLKPLLLKLQNDENIELQILVAGMHLSREFGLTYEIIEKDGFICNEKVEMILSSDSSIAISKSMGLGMIGFSEALTRLKPDILVTLGDRFENMAIVTTAWVCRVPVAHIQGGEKTLGAIDDQFRHCITKLSTIHFVAANEYRNRVIQLGEDPARVFNVGALNVEALKNIDTLSKSQLEQEIGFSFSGKTLLVTFHPVTLENNTAEANFKQLLDAIDDIPELKIIFTKTLADTDGRIINEMIDNYVSINGNKAISFTSMGQLRYISALKYIGAIAGNSSSGIIETPSFNLPTVNIGKREEGRIMADNVICVKQDFTEIKKGIEKALSKEFKESLTNMINPYERKGTASNIANVLSIYNLSETTMKEFYDIKNIND
jgi:GDP/UDP-N,N'-diacetylbacillosamine 2-epimerase (hydrolysing)